MSKGGGGGDGMSRIFIIFFMFLDPRSELDNRDFFLTKMAPVLAIENRKCSIVCFNINNLRVTEFSTTTCLVCHPEGLWGRYFTLKEDVFSFKDICAKTTQSFITKIVDGHQ